MDSTDNIAEYYLNSPLFINITQNEKFKSITIEELLNSPHVEYLRDDSEIEDNNDFIFVLICLTYWSVDKLPDIIYKYLDINLFTDFELDNYENLISTTIIDDILNYIGSKFIDNKTIACGNYHSVAIREDYTVVTWGRDDNQDKSLSCKFIAVACGENHSVGIREDNIIITWGDNYFNQKENSPSGKFIKIACGSNHSVGIRENGSIVTWGNNEYKQITNSPEGKFISIECGTSHSVGIREDQTIVTWGNSDEDGNQINGTPFGNFIAIACGRNHSVGIREDNRYLG